jgi:hypothetical protein
LQRERVGNARLITRELGLSGFTVFNYDTHAEAVLPYLRLGVSAPTGWWPW